MGLEIRPRTLSRKGLVGGIRSDVVTVWPSWRDALAAVKKAVPERYQGWESVGKTCGRGHTREDRIMDVTLAASLDEYFHEVVTDALEVVEVEASEPASWYLVGLLGDMSRARLTDEPLGVKLVEAPADPGERVRALKHVGDTSLYVAGYFAESLTRSLVDVDYYVGLGQSAYAQLARSLGAQRTMGDVYEELASKFPRFVGVLAEVRKRTQMAELGDDIGKLYEMWLKTRDEWIEKKLRAAGVLLDTEHKVLQ
jgi:hypothetical protein